MAYGKWLGVALAASMLSTAAWAQQKPAPIALNVVVTPKKGGAPVAGLSAQDFTLLVNGKPEKITSFNALGGSKSPVEIILVVDTVDAYYTTVAYERKEIDRFLQADGGHLPFPMQLVVFTDTATQIQSGFTQDGNMENKILDQYTMGLRSITRASGVYGAAERLNLGMQAMQGLALRGASLPGRKLLIWMSPGWPVLSDPGMEISTKQQKQIFRAVVDLSNDFRAAKMTVYSIDPLGSSDSGDLHSYYYRNFIKGVKDPYKSQFGDLALQVLVTETGGRLLRGSNDLAALLKQALTDTDAYYSLTFEPEPSEPDEYHKVEVKVANKGLVARTRTGYYGE